MNTCTVSVATTHHRTVPFNCATENINDLSNNITTNTTNLINININNAGINVASGENNQLNSSLSSIPRSTQTQMPSITANGEVNTNTTPRNTTISVCTSQNQNVRRSPICTNSKCQIAQETEIDTKQISSIPAPPFHGKTNKELMKTPSSSRRHHRTIPRHFTAVDPILSESTNTSSSLNKKPTCQCPIKHVPHSYMGTTHFNDSQQNSNGLFMSNLATSKTGKAISRPNSSNSSKASKINSDSISSPPENVSLNSNTMRRTIKSANTISNKIPTISKVVSSDLNSKEVQTVSVTKEVVVQPTTSSNPIHSILKNNTNSLKVLKKSTDIFPIQLTDSVLTNPVLPPKLSKTFSNSKSLQNPINVSNIHTISKPNDNPYYNLTPSFRNYPSTNTIKIPHKLSKTRAKIDEGKTNTYVFLPSGFSGLSANHITYSLPKVTSNKLSLRTSISDVVSKVPSIVNIPSPISTQTTTIINTLASTTSPSTARTSNTSQQISVLSKVDEKPFPLPVCTTSKNCSNPKEHFLPNDTSIDDEYLSECENCKSAHGSRYYLDEELLESPQETMTLQRKLQDNEDEQGYYRTSQTLPTNNKQKST